MTKLEELKAAFEAATGGEWTAPGFNSQSGQVACLLNNPDGLRLVSGNFKRDDAKFIAIAHNTMPTLLEAVDVMHALGEAYDIGQPATPTSAIGRYRQMLEKLK